MSWLSGIFSSTVGGVVDSVGNAIDKLVTSDSERLQLKNELIKIEAEAKLKELELENQYEKEVTQRWVSDNDHWFTRLVRPLSYTWVVFFFTFIMIGDSNFGFSIKEAYIPVIETLLITMTIALFGSRGVEKVIRRK